MPYFHCFNVSQQLPTPAFAPGPGAFAPGAAAPPGPSAWRYSINLLLLKNVKTEIKASAVAAIVAFIYIISALMHFPSNSGLGVAELFSGVAHGLLAGAVVAIRSMQMRGYLRIGALAGACVVTSCVAGLYHMYSKNPLASDSVPSAIITFLTHNLIEFIAIVWLVATLMTVGYAMLWGSIVAAGVNIASEAAEVAEAVAHNMREVTEYNSLLRPGAVRHDQMQNASLL